MDSTAEMSNDDKEAEQQGEEADAYEHIKQGAESYDAQTHGTLRVVTWKFESQLTNGLFITISPCRYSQQRAGEIPAAQ